MNDLRTDTRNVYAGAVTLTQPIFMGGKIRAYNQITVSQKGSRKRRKRKHAGNHPQHGRSYWQVVSLANKKRLAESFLSLVKKLDSDVEKMIREGVATKADGLSVKVKVNEARNDTYQVNDGLSLARMLLCQRCAYRSTHPSGLQTRRLDDLTLPPNSTAANVERHWPTVGNHQPGAGQ